MEPVPPSMLNTTTVVGVTTREDLESRLFESFASRDQESRIQERGREKRRKQEVEARENIAMLEEKARAAPERSTAAIEKKLEQVGAIPGKRCWS